MRTKKEKEAFDLDKLIYKIKKTRITKNAKDLQREKMIKLVNENRELKNIMKRMKVL